MDIQGLRYKYLPATSVIANFVKNDPNCNSEHYLVELLNQSKWFSRKHEKKFIWCKDQSNKQCDAYSEEYGLDFKLVLAQTRLHGISVFSTRYALLPDGTVSTLPCKKQKGTITATRLHTALRGLTVDNLKAIRCSKYDYQTIEFDIQEYLDTLETKKNLLLFYPCQFYFVEQYQHNRSIENFLYALNSDFASSFAYRTLVTPDYDTFFVTIYYDDFILCEIKDNAASYLESIPTDNCPTFVHLLNVPKRADDEVFKKWLG